MQVEYEDDIALMMKAASISESSVNFYQNTRRNNQKTAIIILAAVRTSNLTGRILIINRS
jgi:hypothetical protein